LTTIMHLTQTAVKGIVFHMVEKPKGDSKTSWWILLVVMILAVLYFYLWRRL